MNDIKNNNLVRSIRQWRMCDIIQIASNLLSQCIPFIIQTISTFKRIRSTITASLFVVYSQVSYYWISTNMVCSTNKFIWQNYRSSIERIPKFYKEGEPTNHWISKFWKKEHVWTREIPNEINFRISLEWWVDERDC